MDFPRRVEVVEQFKNSPVKVIQVHHFKLEFHSVPCKDLIAAHVHPPTDKDGELLQAFISSVKVQVRIVPDTSNAKFQLLTIHFFMDGGNGESNDTGGFEMLDYEEEIKKFKPSLEVEDIEDAVYQEDLTDMTDILRQMTDAGSKR